jgi:ferricrocin synthase
LTGTNLELVLSIQDGNSRILKHQHTPLRFIQRWFEHPDQSLFDTIFVYQKSNDWEGKKALAWEVIQEDAFVDVYLPIISSYDFY